MGEDKSQQLYLELERIIEPQLTNGFCGYNEDTQLFDMALAVKEILDYKIREIAKLKIQLDEYKQLLAKKSIRLTTENRKLENALDEIVEIVKQTCSQRCTNDCFGTKKHCGYGAVLSIINKAKKQ